MSAGEMEVFEKHPDCLEACRYAKDIDMQNYSCAGKCVYLDRKTTDEHNCTICGNPGCRLHG